ncbi:MAG: hypothetical protein P1U80_05645 [Pseudomonadales bacterium]|nr:hypothetical protein [Pseudomonadales bacterium]
MYRLYLFSEESSDANGIAERLGEQFEYSFVVMDGSLDSADEWANADAFIICMGQNESQCVEFCCALNQHAECEHIPVIVLSVTSPTTEQRLNAYQNGCTEWVSLEYGDDVITSRINKEIFHKIADGQLRNNLKTANQMAFQAMADTSDLGVTVQFLLDSGTASNIDTLGQHFFQAVKHYSLNCSVQIRSQFGIKDMEANGMARELESKLLGELKDSGRYFDFGGRTICNYENVSVLIKNMPTDDPVRYGTIKDNTFALVQGLNTRVIALDNQRTIEREKQLLTLLTERMNDTMLSIDNSYQEIMRSICDSVEDMSAKTDDALTYLSLTEEQEKTMEEIASTCLLETNKIFNQGLRIDSEFRAVMDSVTELLYKKDSDSFNSDFDNILDALRSAAV